MKKEISVGAIMDVVELELGKVYWCRLSERPVLIVECRDGKEGKAWNSTLGTYELINLEDCQMCQFSYKD